MSRIQKIKLSICIPTYNFGNYIGNTLSCIIDQIVPGVEVVVLDGASTDGTGDVVRRFQQSCHSLVYRRQDFKGGIDIDMVKVVSLARGEYCWLMSSDDLIQPGALHRVLSEIESGNDIYLCNRTECDINMVPVRDRYWLKRNVEDRVFSLHDNYDLENYLRSSVSLGALFSYMSSIIFKKNSWDAVCDKGYASGTCYGHVYILFSLIHYTCNLKYIREPLVLCRFGNDSFSDNGFIRRVSIDFDGYRKIADKLFIHDSVMKDVFNSVLRKDYPLYRVVKIRAFSNNVEWQEIVRKLLGIGYNPLFIFICGMLGRYRPFVSKLINLKHRIEKIRSFVYMQSSEWTKKGL